jgi:macrolide transport system ATP-binding/permease protein
MTPPLLSLTAISRRFQNGNAEVTVLNNLSLDIHAGEMVVIMGPSGSGKSTLMNILGCLDRPSDGAYRIDGRDVQHFDSNARARLRRERFGFIFQRYHLIPSLSVADNVEVPARYARHPRALRRDKALRLLSQLGLSGLETRGVTRLSGGQQQRVSIARALINGGEIILADEPTGALDSQNGRDVMQLLQQLHRQGHTVIIITHDIEVARYAGRILRLCDGQLCSDQPNQAEKSEYVEKSKDVNAPPLVAGTQGETPHRRLTRWEAITDNLLGACRTLSVHKMRSGLTLLGIVIGIVSVVCLNAAGEGARRYVLDTLATLGGNVITLHPGKGFGDDEAASRRSLGPRDLKLLLAQPWVKAATPNVNASLRIRWQRADTNASVNGTSAEFLETSNLETLAGRSLLPRDVAQNGSVVIINQALQQKLFPTGIDPLGQIILVGTQPCRIVGVMRSTSAYNNGALTLWMPWTTASSRLLGQNWFSSIAVSLENGLTSESAKKAIQSLLTRLHGRQDFYMQDSAAFVSSIEKTSFALTLFLSLIALISLLVGGIGVMNIMLVSVTERTRETGVRMAVGARPRDIQWQFLTEAVLLCLIGAAIGVTVSLGLGVVLALFIPSWQMVFSLKAMLIAVGCAVVVGMLSGWLPAWQAARLDPAEALARE